MRNRIGIVILVLVLVVAMIGVLAARASLSTSPPPAQVPSADELWQRANSCTCLTLYTHPETGAPIVLKAIASAQKSIRLKMYLFTRDDVRDALIDAAKRGVDVRVLMELNIAGGQATNVDVYNAMKNTPVRFRWASFDFRYTHEKSLVIDDQIALIMTHNITTSSFNKTGSMA